jgi:IS605 OrfB family transposase
VIRTEKQPLKATPTVRASAGRLISFFRESDDKLRILIDKHWDELATAKHKCQAVETLFHFTKGRPKVKYPELDRFIGKAPSYLRRAIIESALGGVSSYRSNLANWLSGPQDTAAPTLGKSGAYPPLYGGNMIVPGKGLRTVRIKMLDADGQWRWSPPLRLNGKFKRLLPLANKFDFCPTLILKGSKLELACPVEVHAPKSLTNEEFVNSDGVVCAIDLNVTTAVVAVILDIKGTVKARKFLTCGRHNDQRDELGVMIADKVRESGGTVKGQPHCTTLHRRIAGLNNDAAKTLASQVAKFATDHGVTVFVIENMKGWRPKGPSRKMRKRFHRFHHRAIVKALEFKAQEMGARVLAVDPRGTSRNAYDGSGKVKRSTHNARLATFTTGKRYNADLNGALNIGAKGLAVLLGIKTEEEICQAETGKSSGSVTRIPFVLADIWNYWASFVVTLALAANMTTRLTA